MSSLHRAARITSHQKKPRRVDAAFLVDGFLARRVSRQQAVDKEPSLVVPWFNRPFVARETPVLHVVGVTVNDKLPDKDVVLAV